jgi:hypothetical protein
MLLSRSCESLLEMGSLKRIDTPGNPVDLEAFLSVDLPKSAKNMYVAQYAAGLQTLDEYIRFEVSPDDISEAISAIVKWDTPPKNDMSFYDRRPIEPSRFINPGAEIGKLSWWQLDSIRRGYVYLKKDDTRQFWVDLDKNVIYFHWTH